uniref:Uncharacterized protein n=1 Tax=Octactis speculum TaxID=3111310 RepID=A0A7S2FXJ5_9STRA|mmetsp:Transcript_32092/g.43438  ORF Transcript_32092/g.43438 Transcript_32092/m.43438 type:complete len:103 (+) Transcript_32092:3-311(+)
MHAEKKQSCVLCCKAPVVITNNMTVCQPFVIVVRADGALGAVTRSALLQIAQIAQSSERDTPVTNAYLDSNERGEQAEEPALDSACVDELEARISEVVRHWQ